MLTIENYIEWALEKQKLKSDSDLCRALELSLVQVCHWRKRKVLPSDESMVKLAKLAGADIVLALHYIGWWRAVSRNEHQAAAVFLSMIQQYEKVAA
jgi:hypothetical protein